MRKHILYTILALLIAYNALASPPGWTVVPSNYNNSMTYTGVIMFSGIESTDTNDIIAAFVGTECRGMVKPILLQPISRCVAFLVVYSNSSSGENIVFKIYDASSDSIITATQSGAFASYTSVGMISSPFVWSDLVAAFAINGVVTYENTAQTTLANLKLSLKNQDGLIIDTATTDLSGNYSFSPKANGNYTIVVNTSKTWGGVNSTDALVLRRHITGKLADPLSGLKLKVGDVNASNSYNSTDALFIQRRSSGKISSFAAGNWLFNPDTIKVNQAPVTKNFKGLCVGDVNASYTAIPKAKIIPTVDLNKMGTMSVKAGDVVDIPIKVSHNMETGAASFYFTYPYESMEILSVNSVMENNADLDYTVNNGEVLIAWSSLTPYNFTSGETVFSIKALIKSVERNNPLEFSLIHSSEFADAEANVIQSVDLQYPGLVASTNYSETAFEGLEINLFPNPCIGQTKLITSLPSDGDLFITIYNSLGEKVWEATKYHQIAGETIQTIDTKDFASGIYHCKIILQLQDGNSLTNNRILSVLNK